MTRFMFALLAALLAAACTSVSQLPPPDRDAARRAVADLLAETESAAARGDVDGVVAGFTDDAVSEPADVAPLVGKASIDGFYRPLYDGFNIDLHHEILEAEPVGTVVVHRGRSYGTLVPKTGGAPQAFELVYLAVLKWTADSSVRFWRVMSHPAPVTPGT